MVFRTSGVSAIRDPKAKFMSATVLSRTKFRSDVDSKNCVTSKSLNGQGYMTNGYKAGRVAQIFGVQIRDRILTEQPRFLLFPYCNLLYSSFLYLLSEVITLGLVMLNREIQA
jgi:hypothetical protein